MNIQKSQDTIVAISTPPGNGGIGIIRISGKLALHVANSFFNKIPIPRKAEYLTFYNNKGNILDKVITIFFPQPNSFTGEDILEIHGHGGKYILDLLIQNILQKIPEIRMANPGEFTARAFLNNKIDLIQAESIADLISASSHQSAIAAANSLNGNFSKYILQLTDKITILRTYIEAMINFPNEDITSYTIDNIETKLNKIIKNIYKIYNQAKQGSLLKDGIKLVITGEVNAGKSSLLNLLTGCETAIVTDIPGTTRDTLHDITNLNGIPIHITDTAGLRKTHNKIEKIGIKRTLNAIRKANHVLFMHEAQNIEPSIPFIFRKIMMYCVLNSISITVIRNKIDLTKEKTNITKHDKYTIIALSVKNKQGIDILKEHLKNNIQQNKTENESTFIARRRHIEILNNVLKHILNGKKQLIHYRDINDILAEDLRLAHKKLEEITGKNTSSKILENIFSNFCIGK